MDQQVYDKSYAGSLPENYERYFVAAIGGPVAHDLIEIAALRPGERVLDVACGTGVVTRLAAERVGDSGWVAGLDVNPGMLGVARAVAPPGASIDWYETSAEAMPLPDDSFDVVLCQMGLQFIPDKHAALREIRRVLVPGGRVVINLPGPRPAQFAIMGEALARHISPDAAGFAGLVFSLHEEDELRQLMSRAGFRQVAVRKATEELRVPPPRDFFWQYIHSTPLANAVAQVDDRKRAALECDVCEQWEQFVVDGAMKLSVDMTTVTGRK